MERRQGTEEHKGQAMTGEILEIRRRATGMPQDVPRASAIEQAAREVLKDLGGQAERVLAALVGIGEGEIRLIL